MSARKKNMDSFSENAPERSKPFFVACYVLLIKGSKVLLLKRQNTGFEDGNYSLIAGHVESNESILDAIIREAHEETGIKIDRDDLFFHRVIHRKGSDRIYIDFFFTCCRWEGTPINQEPSKCAELTWADINKLPENVIPYVKQVIKSLDKEKPGYDEVGWG